MITDINSEDRLVQKTFADHLRERLGWESVYAWNDETFGPHGTLGRASRARGGAGARPAGGARAPEPGPAGIGARTRRSRSSPRIDFARSLIQHNREFYGFIRDGVPVEWRDAQRRDRGTRRRG